MTERTQNRAVIWSVLAVFVAAVCMFWLSAWVNRAEGKADDNAEEVDDLAAVVADLSLLRDAQAAEIDSAIDQGAEVRTPEEIAEETPGSAEPSPQGPQGERGEIGPAGPRGPEGPRGERGFPGVSGRDGKDGIDGKDGSRGPQGVPGSRGPAGDPGVAGPTGSPGPVGAEGSPGIPGVPGPQGDSGSAGEQGIPGPAGADGAPGPAGPQGDSGPAGPKGEPGVSVEAVALDVVNDEGTCTATVTITVGGEQLTDSASFACGEPVQNP